MAVTVLAGSAASAREEPTASGGTFRIVQSEGVGVIDPTRTGSNSPGELPCAMLLNLSFRDTRGAAPVLPEVAAGWPKVTDAGKTYTFVVRAGFRFSDGTPLTAQNYASAIDRALNPAMRSFLAEIFGDIVGADAVKAGKAAHASGVRASRYKLVIQLTRPTPDFLARLFHLCPLPSGLPLDPEGVGAPFSGAGPYVFSSWTRDGDLVATRNPFYRGKRAHHVARYTFKTGFTGEERLRMIEQNQADCCLRANDLPESGWAALVRRYGINRGQLFVRASIGVFFVAMNTDRPLLKNNLPLRRAVNFALDRRALTAAFGPLAGNATDQLIAPGVSGFRNAAIYPLKGPDLRTAQRLARNRTGDGRAILYVRNTEPHVELAQIVKRNLSAIGLLVEIQEFPRQIFFTKLATPGEPFDLAIAGNAPNYPDPYSQLADLLGGRADFNWANFDVPKYDRLLARAAALPGRARYDALAAFEAEILRTQAPYAPFFHTNERLFVSRRVGCIRMRPFLDLTGVCLKR